MSIGNVVACRICVCVYIVFLAGRQAGRVSVQELKLIRSVRPLKSYMIFALKESCRQDVSHREDISRKWRSARIRTPDGNKRSEFRCVSFVPEEGAPEPVCVLCRECLTSLPTCLLGTQYTNTDTTCYHITDGHNYHFLTSF